MTFIGPKIGVNTFTRTVKNKVDKLTTKKTTDSSTLLVTVTFDMNNFIVINRARITNQLNAIKESVIKEELEPEDYIELREIIRAEIASIFFDLYKKKNVWK